MTAIKFSPKPQAAAQYGVLLLGLLLLGVSVSRLIYPFDVGHYEACTWEPAWLSLTGHNPYAYAKREPFVMAPYGYVYYLAIGVGLRLFGWQLWCGRLLTVCAAAACAVCVKRLAEQLSGSREAAWFGVLVMCAAITVHHWIGVHRPDWLALALAWVGLTLIFTMKDAAERSGWRMGLSIVLFTAAFFIKQTTVLACLIAVCRCLQVRKPGLAATLLSGVLLLSGLLMVALQITSHGEYFWQHFVLMSHIPPSYAMSRHWVMSLAKSPAQWLTLLIIVAGWRGLVASPEAAATVAQFSGKALPPALFSARSLIFGYFLLAAIVGFVTSAQTGSYINYYLEFTLVSAVAAALAWQHLSARWWFRRVEVALLVLMTVAGVFEFSRMARAELYRWQSLAYYREVVTTLREVTAPGQMVISIHPELAVAAGRGYCFGDWIQYQDGRSAELRKLLEAEVYSGRVSAIIWGSANLPFSNRYTMVQMKTPLPVKHYPVFLFVPLK